MTAPGFFRVCSVFSEFSGGALPFSADGPAKWRSTRDQYPRYVCLSVLRGVMHPMQMVIHVRLSVAADELPRFLVPAAEPTLRALFERLGGTLQSLSLHPPDGVELYFTLPAEPQPTADSIEQVMRLLRGAFGLRPGPHQIVPPARTGATGTRRLQFGGTRGRGRVCAECGGADERHERGCPRSRS